MTDPYQAIYENCPVEAFRALGHVSIRSKDHPEKGVSFPEEWMPVVQQMLRDVARDIQWNGVIEGD